MLFLRFKLYKKSLRLASFYRSWQTKLLNYEIDCIKKDIKELTLIIKNDGKNVSSFFSAIDAILIRQSVKSFVNKFESTSKATHDKKLRDLGVNNDLSPCDPIKFSCF